MEWACPCRKSKSVGPFVYDRGVRCEIEDDGSVIDATGRRRFPVYISHRSYGLIVVETETMMRLIRALRATYGRCDCKRTVTIHSCKCGCSCNRHSRRKNKQNRHKVKAIDQATQIHNTTTADAAVQVDTAQETSEKPASESGEEQQQLSRELVIPDSSVSALRRFLSRNADSQVLAKFDSDDRFQSKLLHKLQPLVHVERSPKIKELMQKRFAAVLGLKYVADVRQDSIDSNSSTPRATPLSWLGGSSRSQRREDKERSGEGEALPRRRRPSSSESNSSEPIVKPLSSHRNATSSSQRRKVKERSHEAEAPPKRKLSPSSDRTKRRDVTEPKVFKLDKKTRRKEGKENSNKREKSKAREYTPLEDAAIVRWVCVGGASRERKVNGNQIWKQLQEEYSVLSGQERSWHSLRNRYLRYILPSLQRRGDVAAAVASRLRAHAAMGQTKAAPDPVEERPRVISAWSLRPRTPRTSHSPADPQNLRSRRPLYNPRSVGD